MGDFENLYNQICGFSTHNDKYENEFGHGGLCSELSQKAYLARCRIENRLNSFEDEDVLELINAHEEMQRIIAFKVYLYSKNYSSM